MPFVLIGPGLEQAHPVVLEWVSPTLNRVDRDIVFTGQLGQCLFTLEGRKGPFRLERRRVVSLFSSPLLPLIVE